MRERFTVLAVGVVSSFMANPISLVPGIEACRDRQIKANGDLP